MVPKVFELLKSRIAEKAVPKAINSRALNSQKPCINMEFHAPLKHMFLTFHMQDSGQYSINTEEVVKFAVEAINLTVYVRVMQIRIL